jgi:hypothetical protein
MIIVGGVYKEECVSPRFAGLVGPGLRAAMTLSGLSTRVHLHTIAAQGLAEDIKATCDACRINVTLHKASGEPPRPITFWYANALRPLVPAPRDTKGRRGQLKVKGESILLLGLMEARTTVVGGSVVYEPEAESPPDLFTKGPSRADRLGVVLKAQVFRKHSAGRQAPDVARSLMNETGAEVLIVRSELGSATVFQADHPPKVVGPYETRRWHRLGMGNVFSAIFAHHWVERQASAENAAREACRALAQYNEGGGSLPILDAPAELLAEASHLHVPLMSEPLRPTVRLEGCNARYVERHLFNDAIDALEVLATDVETRVPISDLDLAPTWNDSFSAMLVMADFADHDVLGEAARAAAAGKPVISYSEYPTFVAARLRGIAGVEPVDDFITAIYRTAVGARRPLQSRPT